MLQVRDLLYTENINEQTRDKFAVLTSCQQKSRMSKKHAERFGNEVNSTGSFLSDLSVTQSEDDLLEVPSAATNKWRKHRPSYTADAGSSFIGTKRSRISTDGGQRHSTNAKRKFTIYSLECTAIKFVTHTENHQEMDIGPNDKIIASTRVSIPQGNGPITAESIIEAVPNNCEPRRSPTKSPPPQQQQNHNSKMQFTPSAPVVHEVNYAKVVPDFTSNYNAYAANATGRLHKFIHRTFLKTDTCHHCQKK